jgi:hypothetical protein
VPRVNKVKNQAKIAWCLKLREFVINAESTLVVGNTMKTPDNAIIKTTLLELTEIDPNFFALAIFPHWRKPNKLKAQNIFAP